MNAPAAEDYSRAAAPSPPSKRPSRLDYYRRVLSTGLLGPRGHRSFWHEEPELNPPAFESGSRAYYMTFRGKAGYAGPFDNDGVPMLDYRGAIGLQYNPIAIAQYGLGNYNVYLTDGNAKRLDAFLAQARWLAKNLEVNAAGLAVWNHHFDWFYREGLRAPWYSALAQGPGISALLRAALETGDSAYRHAAGRAFEAFLHTTAEGGVTHRDEGGDLWLEEYLVDPPSHVLNGLIWASWGLYDAWKLDGDQEGRRLFDEVVGTLRRHLHRYDTGFWSCYEIRPKGPPMVASQWYHRLHITQLEVMYRLTGDDVFSEWAARWRAYGRHPAKRWMARVYRLIFKILQY